MWRCDCLGRLGIKTLVVERLNCLGGAWTSGFINPFFDTHEKAGIVNELVSELDAQGNWGGFWNISFNYEYMKNILERKMKEANVDILYNTTFSRTLVENNKVYGAVFENIEGRFAVKAKMVVDATGDGCVASSAGCPFELGVDGDYTQCQAMTLMFMVGNIPPKYKDGMMIYEKLNAVYEKAGKQIPLIKKTKKSTLRRFFSLKFSTIYIESRFTQRQKSYIISIWMQKV
ncbi:MAG: FAD-dependent oxidoreductase [Clostridia bacterium]|nr:FAD-dependent oxidoreductase [Clostridia bacterium]